MEIVKEKRLWLSLLVLLIIISASYLPNIANAGYIGDDWSTIFVIKQKGISNLTYHYSFDRPLRGYHSILLARIFGTRLPLYQISSLLNRLLDSFFTWLIFTLLWPKRWSTNLMIASLTLVFPGYHEQLHAFDYQVHQFASMLIKFSILLSLLPFRLTNKAAKLLCVLFSIGSALIGWGIMEWFIGLEVFRWWALFVIFRQEKGPNSIKRAVLYTLVYLLNGTVFMVWRLFLYEPRRDSVSGSTLMSSLSNLSGIVAFLKALLENLTRQVITAWYQPLTLAIKIMDQKELLAGILLSVVGGILVLVLISRKSDPEEPSRDRYVANLILGGLLIAVGALIPIIFGQRSIQFINAADRFSLPGSMGSCMLIVGLVGLFQKKPQRMFLSFVFLSSAILTQFGYGIEFKRNDEITNAVWWQFTWRSPDIEPGTLVAGRMSHGELVESFSIWAPLNMLYYSGHHEVIITSEILSEGTKDFFLDPEVRLDWERGNEIINDFHQLLLFSINSRGCLHLIDGEHPEISAFDDPIIADVAYVSQISRIRTASSKTITPDPTIFGPEPAQDWCYFYQKGQLARQRRDWSEAANMGRMAIENQQNPKDPIEWLVFAQAFKYVGSGHYDTVRNEINQDPYTVEAACRVYATYRDELANSPQAEAHQQLMADFCE